MFSNAALDVVIGLVFVYLLYSLLGTLIQEIIATNIGLRGCILKLAIQRMLDDDDTTGQTDTDALTQSFEKINALFSEDDSLEEPDLINRIESYQEIERLLQGNKHNDEINPQFSEAFYDHPLIKYLSANTWLISKKPSYIDPQTFSKVVIDLLRGSAAKPGSSDRHLIQTSLDTKKITWDKTSSTIDRQTAIYLRSIWADSQGDVIKFKASLEQWFNETMDRTTGWYKKYTQIILLVVGLVIAVVFNVDTIQIATKLQNSPKLRDQILQQADSFTKSHPDLDKEIAQRDAEISALNNPKNTASSTTPPVPNNNIATGNKVNSTTDTPKQVLAAQKQKDKGAKGASNKEDKKNISNNTTVVQGTTANTAIDTGFNKNLKDSLTTQNKKEKELRDSLYSQANTLVNTNIKDVNNILGLGWHGGFGKNSSSTSILGWLLTALAISMGAPFWFDLLNKLMQLRSSIAPPDDAKAKANAATSSTPSPTNRVG